MKITIRIFTFYILALSIVPCSDGGSGIVEIIKHYFDIEHQEFSDHEQHSNSCGDDNCSTFCICSCCSANLDFPSKTVFKIKTPTPFTGLKPSFVLEIIHSSFFAPVWQPPKFS
jgi:hypothetical protein